MDSKTGQPEKGLSLTAGIFLLCIVMSTGASFMNNMSEFSKSMTPITGINLFNSAVATAVFAVFWVRWIWMNEKQWAPKRPMMEIPQSVIPAPPTVTAASPPIIPPRLPVPPMIIPPAAPRPLPSSSEGDPDDIPPLPI